MKLRTVRDTILPSTADAAHMPATYVPAVQTMNPMPTLGLSSAIGLAALQALMNPLGLAPILSPAPDVAADVAPAAAAGGTIAATSNNKEK
jgi:hypothetical protein